MWKALLYVQSEIAEEEQLHAWIAKPQQNIRCMDLGPQWAQEQTIAEACKKLRVELTECLMIVTTEAEWQLTQQLNLAALPYEKEGSGEVFPGAWLVVQGFEHVDYEFLNRVYLRHHQLPWVMLETKRLILRELALSDMDALFSLYDDSRVTKYTEKLYPREEEVEYQKAYIRNMYQFYGYGMWLVCLRDTGEVIGRAGLENRIFNETAVLEMGYLIAAKEWNKGYATEACEALISFAKRELDFSEINCFIQKGNVVSIHLAEKLGFSFSEETLLEEKPMLRYVLEC